MRTAVGQHFRRRFEGKNAADLLPCVCICLSVCFCAFKWRNESLAAPLGKPSVFCVFDGQEPGIQADGIGSVSAVLCAGATLSRLTLSFDPLPDTQAHTNSSGRPTDRQVKDFSSRPLVLLAKCTLVCRSKCIKQIAEAPKLIPQKSSEKTKKRKLIWPTSELAPTTN